MSYTEPFLKVKLRVLLEKSLTHDAGNEMTRLALYILRYICLKGHYSTKNSRVYTIHLHNELVMLHLTRLNFSYSRQYDTQRRKNCDDSVGANKCKHFYRKRGIFKNYTKLVIMLLSPIMLFYFLN